jgi:hypothetical protein
VDKKFQELQAFRREPEKWRKLELPDYACTADGAIELCDDQWGGTTGAGLGNKWHLGYSNVVIIANILSIVNIFDKMKNNLIYGQFI